MKKLLILGANYIEIDVVKDAQRLGYYVIVTDNRPNRLDSPAKKVADEAWDISWSDVEALEAQCKSEQVDGILAGFSEFRVECMIELCRRLKLPCGISMEQLDVTRDKKKFKKLCEQFLIPTVPEYLSVEQVREYPVIVKPVDRAGSIGINVAYNQEELFDFYATALKLSPSRNVIIEKYIDKGTKFDIYYYVKDGQPVLLGTSDTVMCKGTKGASILQKAWTFPSLYQSQYINEVDAKIRQMFKGLGIHDCYATISAFYMNGSFYFFEAGFRMSGELSHHYYNSLTGINYNDSIIKYAMGVNDEIKYVEVEALPTKYSVILNYFGLDGIAKDVVSKTEIQSEELVSANYYIRPGEGNYNETKVFHKILMLTFCSSDLRRLLKTVNTINRQVYIMDNDGNDMIYELVTPSELETAFNLK